jgi:hypothetical protein
LVGQLFGWMVKFLALQLVVCLFGWLVDLLVGWLVMYLVF